MAVISISWGTIKSLLIFFGPMLLPKALGWYRSARALASQTHGRPIKPVSSSISCALVLLFSISAAFLVRTLPIFSPENIFAVTRSRLKIPVDVLFTRLSALRPLTAADEALRGKFVNIENKLLYLQFGPDVLAACPFCTADEPRSYLFYALPALLAPHLLNLAVIALVTAPAATGRAGSSWRTVATIGAVGLAMVDLLVVSQYSYQANRQAKDVSELDFFFWSARVYRSAGLALLNFLLGLALYQTSTNRMFVSPPSPAERVETTVRALQGVRGKLDAAGVVKNTTIRDDGLREHSSGYWGHEVRLMRDMMEEREVIEGVNDALQNRIDIQSITRNAEQYAANLIQPGGGPVQPGPSA
ncbi:hypothetical protein B0H63DRAFT_559137 [Podospora didyma]|uniref:Chorismate synthase protein n=1 Tax=Podospora didyma TaxID=330526 RepID=A0AAE0NU06_9PEZI|nr:hypothetical protein B0H63DRAFT_559137 [Podospora didyma]